MSWHIPTLDDRPASWPAGLTMSLGPGERAYVRCPTCGQDRDAGDVFDLRAAPPGLKLPPILCTHCLHHLSDLRGGIWRPLAVALGCSDATTLASHAAVDDALERARASQATGRRAATAPNVNPKPRRA